MHISTSAIYVILLSFLGGSKTAHAVSLEDAFGVTNYGIQCQDRLYPKHFIYAAAKNFCDTEKMPGFSDRDYATVGFKTRIFYYFNSKEDITNMLKDSHLIVPILEDGKLYPLVFHKKSTGEIDERDPGPDRLVIDKKCNIVGAFTDFNYKTDSIVNRMEKCRILKSFWESLVPWGRSPERSSQRSPPRSSDQSSESSSQRSPPTSRDQSPEPSRQHTRYHSNEILPEIASGRTIDQPAKRIPELSRQNTRFYSTDTFPEIASGRTIDQSAKRIPELSRQNSRFYSTDTFPETYSENS